MDSLTAITDFAPITKRYLLCVNIKSYFDEKGHRYLEQLWYKDLQEHLRYLKNFTLVCPCQYGELPNGLVAIDNDPLFSELSIIDLPAAQSFTEGIMLLPVTMIKLWQSIKEADIVHTGIAGWPIPFGWLITPIVKLQRKFYIIIVESAPWRCQPGIPVTIKSRIMAFLWETLGCWCVNQADLAVFTQAEYKASLLTRQQQRGYIIPASMIKERK